MTKEVKSRLDRFLASIDPDRTLAEIRRRVDAALNSFPAAPRKAAQGCAFDRLMGDFYCHVENHILRLQPPRPTNLAMDWGRCYRVLTEIYGPDGEKTAFTMVRTGVDGGLPSVLHGVADRLVQFHGDNEVRARTSAFLSSLSPDEVLAAAEEYAGKYGHLLPAEFVESDAVRLKLRFFTVLTHHPELVQLLRQVGR